MFTPKPPHSRIELDATVCKDALANFSVFMQGIEDMARELPQNCNSDRLLLAHAVMAIKRIEEAREELKSLIWYARADEMTGACVKT